MKNLNLQELSLDELRYDEMRDCSGGWWQAVVAAMSVVIYLYNEGGDFIEGFKKGYNSVPK